ncbi:hypothetical protein ACQR16_16630 [Bradyrhizobium oligotrophicum]|uniref:hypothetical protein n=1 Tax=Bradyrhizobium oligotrophicum TaxID=44255 RepID=UPI003EB91586
MAAIGRSVLRRADERQVADVKSRGPGAPTLAPSWWVMMITPTTVAIKPDTGEIAYNRENHRAGNAG